MGWILSKFKNILRLVMAQHERYKNI